MLSGRLRTLRSRLLSGTQIVWRLRISETIHLPAAVQQRNARQSGSRGPWTVEAGPRNVAGAERQLGVVHSHAAAAASRKWVARTGVLVTDQRHDSAAMERRPRPGRGRPRRCPLLRGPGAHRRVSAHVECWEGERRLQRPFGCAAGCAVSRSDYSNHRTLTMYPFVV